MNEESIYLSKSLFIRGLQCHKSQYLHKYHSELKDEVTESKEAFYEIGYEVGDYAKRLFPGGTEIVYEENNYAEQLELTRSEIEKGTTTIYEAAFSYDNIFVKADILHKGKEGRVLYEVKSAESIKEHYYNDISLQFYVIKGCGIPVSKAFIVHINDQYVKDGKIEPSKLFTIADVTAAIEQKQGFVKDEIEKMRTMLSGELPVRDIGEHCSDPYECDFCGHCWQHIPEEYSVFDLKGNGANKYDLYRQGILQLKDIPLDVLPYGQRIQVEMFIKKGNIVDRAKIKEFLDSLWYPMYFLDFETLFMVPIPLFDGTCPYQKVAFQYSLHYIEKEGTELKHHEFLPSNGDDPREQLIRKLTGEIPDNACVLAWNKSFEEGRLKEFKEWFPAYREKIDIIINNMRDPMPLFRSKNIYHWQMNGSFSLKDVLPVLVPEMSYDDLEISNGGMAANAYIEMIQTEDANEREQIRRSLLKYCGLDTLGVVKILEKLREYINISFNISILP